MRELRFEFVSMASRVGGSGPPAVLLLLETPGGRGAVVEGVALIDELADQHGNDPR